MIPLILPFPAIWNLSKSAAAPLPPAYDPTAPENDTYVQSKPGDQLWVVEVIAPFGGAEEMVKDLKDKVFPTRTLNFLAVKDGKREVRSV